MVTVPIELPEWTYYSPKSHANLAGLALQDEATRSLAVELGRLEMLEVVELAKGISVRSSSWVGKINLGDLWITVQPKIQGLPLLNLLRYAYGLRHLRLYSGLEYSNVSSAFQDLLIHQLAVETEELLARGLHRRYERREENLESPRGRIDFGELARQSGLAKASLPCSHYPRLEDTLVNQILLGGLKLGSLLTGDQGLRVRVRRLATLMAEQVSSIPLDHHMLRQLHRQTDRLTAAYQPALILIEMLLDGTGAGLGSDNASVRLPGFLFDMNRFFQAMISRFLHEHLDGYTVHDEHRLKGMLAYDPERNPLHRRAPEPRPDFVVLREGKIAAMLDTKYRDLWAETLPRDMLYQLVIYAMSRDSGGTATILYPSMDPVAKEACIEVRDPLYGAGRGQVVLRPVNLITLGELVTSGPSIQSERRCGAMARWMAIGDQS
jgi:5-methylcytosine-specific restriction enzyme subunit McrC